MIRNGNDDEATAPPDIAFETVTDDRNYYRNHILPWLEGRPIAEITTHDVQCRSASLHNTPVSEDRSAPILSVIMRQTEVRGYRPEGANPCAGIKRYRRQRRQRFLSSAEIRRLDEVLAAMKPATRGLQRSYDCSFLPVTARARS